MRKKIQQQPSRHIPVDWLYNLSEEEREDLRQAWSNATYVLDRLKAIIERKMEPLMLDRDDDYANPNWGYLRADKNGRLRVYEEIYKLLP